MSADGPVPYLLLPGTARAALDHWHRVFGGTVDIASYADAGRTDGPGDHVAHGRLDGDVRVFAADAATDDQVFAATGLMLSLLGTAAPDVLRRWFDGLAADGTVVDALQERPWGDWDGVVRDAFGVTWLIGFEGPALREP